MGNVVVTGGNGFVGSHLVERLEGLEHRVFVPRSNVYNLRCFDKVSKAFTVFGNDKIDIVFHLAATLGGIGYNREHPGKLLYDNLTMGINVIEAAKIYNVSKFIFVSSVCAYPKFIPIPFSEHSLWAGYPEESNAGYGVAKRTMMEMVKAYRQEYGLNGICLLMTNMYGPGDHFDLQTSHVIPAFIRKFIEAKERGDNSIDAWGTGSASRDFLYVDDAVDALILAMDRLDDSEPINIGSGQEVKIADLADLIRKLVGYGGAIAWDASKPDGQPRRVLDINKARTYLGWQPKMSLEEGLGRTIEWYLKQRVNGFAHDAKKL
jgi:GDP-L-fucose synthase